MVSETEVLRTWTNIVTHDKALRVFSTARRLCPREWLTTDIFHQLLVNLFTSEAAQGCHCLESGPDLGTQGLKFFSQVSGTLLWTSISACYFALSSVSEQWLLVSLLRRSANDGPVVVITTLAGRREGRPWNTRAKGVLRVKFRIWDVGLVPSSITVFLCDLGQVM